MARKFAAQLSREEMAFARQVEAAGLASISQAVKAIERHEIERIRFWRDQIAATQTRQGT